MLNSTIIHEGSWSGFSSGDWCENVNVVDFIRKNITPYEGDGTFLASATTKTTKLWEMVSELIKAERANGGVLDVDAHKPGSIVAHDAGYIDKELETVVGLQTDAPLRRAIMPYGGLKMVENGLKAYGFESDATVAEIFTKYRKTHNQGVFDVYTKEMLACRKSGIITGLPDAYGRGRIIGDYRRVALYGVDFLMAERRAIYDSSADLAMTEDIIRQREETTEQYRALGDLKQMALNYGFDISKPAKDSREAIQWVYFAYLAAIKQQNGAAMSIGRVSTFLDIYFERDLRNGTITESEVQELMDHFVMKLRMVRFLRTPEYDQLFSGDPVWVTEAIGGMCEDGRTMVTKNSYRMIHTLYNIGAAPEPNLTVLWSDAMPESFKVFCSQASIDTSSLQYENDDLMRPKFGDDYAIACCVSAMKIGKQMQFFGARANLAKTLLYAINGGRDEKSGAQIAPATFTPITSEYLVYDEVYAKFDQMMDWLAKVYVNSLNVIHYMHDKYSYESLQMALHDKDIYRTLACGIAGLSVCADSLSAIKHAKVKALRNEDGLVYDYEIEGDFPLYGNNDDRVDSLAAELVSTFMSKVRKHPSYRGSVHTQSVLTITSNVVYGKKTGNTPDGRKAGEPFAPGANPMHGRDTNGAIASLSSVAKLPYCDAEDGISYTFAILPNALGKTEQIKADNLAGLMNGYFSDNGHHLNVNVFNRETLLDAMDHPEKYPQLTIRVSGYAVNFIKLTREQQLDVIARTMHTKF